MSEKDPFVYTPAPAELILPESDAFGQLKGAPPDALFGLKQRIAEIREKDARAKIFDLTVGVFRDDKGMPMVFPAVLQAEKELQEERDAQPYPSKEYFKIGGDPEFLRLTSEVIFGKNHPLLQEPHRDRMASFGVMGGTGGLYLCSQLLDRVTTDMNRECTLIYGDPTWSNHKGIFLQNAQLPHLEFRHVGKSGRASLEDMAATLEQQKVISPERFPVVLLHGVCHNPTGLDYDEAQIETLAKILKKYGAHALVDMAYHGFGDGFERDSLMVRHLAEQGIPLMVNYSFSKNMSAYQDRVGAVFVICKDAETARNVQSVGQSHIIRRTWSNPAAHGQRMAKMIMEHSDLRSEWAQNVDHARNMLDGRCDSLGELLHPDLADRVRRSKGMFTIMGYTRAQVQALADGFYDEELEQNVYVVMPAAGTDAIGRGRLNAGGLVTDPAELAILARRLNAVWAA